MEERCKHEGINGSWNSNREYDIVDGKAHSSQGHWVEDRMHACTKFSSTDEQLEKKSGCFFCDKKYDKCMFFEKVLIINKGD